MIGDVIGELGRDAVRALLLDLEPEKAIDFVTCNKENTVGSYGITADTAAELLESGVDVLTLGKHTHVGTVHAKIMPQGTADLTDAVMTSPGDSVIGSDKDAVLERFLTSLPNRLTVASGPCVMNAALVEVDEETGNTTSIERIDRTVN